MKLAKLTLLALFCAALATPALAQPGPGMGPGKGGGRFAIDNNNTVGWTLMSTEERNAHRQKMWSFKSYDECKIYQQEHHQAMETRAKERGKAIVPPRFNACDRMKARGVIQ
jgi:hypothetical protein